MKHLKYVKKILLCIAISILFVTVGCSSSNPSTVTVGYITVVEKDHSNDYKEAWIIARMDVNHGKKEDIKIYIEEAMVWNLIEIGREYFVSFMTDENDKSILIQIAYIGDENSLR